VIIRNQEVIADADVTALYGVHIDSFFDEVSKAFNGCGRVNTDTVKGVT